MSRIRLRPRRSEPEAEFYQRTYPEGYRHTVWPDHVERVAASVEMISYYMNRIRTAADLSCGDAAVLRGLDGLERVRIGDLNGPPGDDVLLPWVRDKGVSVAVQPSHPLPDSLGHLEEPVDLFVCSETLEHLDEPDLFLRLLAPCATYLFLSTPLDEAADSGNTEHYWSWGQDDIHDMLLEAGWSPLEFRKLVPRSTVHLSGAYTYQLWMAVSA